MSKIIKIGQPFINL